MRAFVGIALDDAARAALAPTLATLREEFPASRFTDPRDLHVTVQFLGEVDAPALARIATALAGLSDIAPGTATIAGLDAFPADGPPRTLFARVADDDAHCAFLAHHVGLALAPLGHPPDARPYVPHVTLARLDPTASERIDDVRGALTTGGLAPFIARGTSPRPPGPSTAGSPRLPLAIRSLTLFESRGAPPPRYQALVTFPLAVSPPSRVGPPVTGATVSPGRPRASGEP